MGFFSLNMGDFFADPFFRPSGRIHSEVRQMAEMVDALFIGERIRSNRQRATFYESRNQSFPARRDSPEETAFSTVPRIRSGRNDISPSSSSLRRGGIAWWFQPGKLPPSHQSKGGKGSKKANKECTKLCVPDEELLWRSSLRQPANARAEKLPPLSDKNRSSPNTFPRRSHRNRPGQGSRTEYASPVPQQRNTRQFRDLGSKKKPGTKFQQSSLDKDADSGAADSSSSESHAVENDDKRQSKNGEEVRSVLGLDSTLVSALENEVISPCPDVKWGSVAGLEEAKRLLQEALILPLLVPDFFTGIRRPWRGVLLVGPPGTGKTLLAKAVATECKATFFNVTSATLISKYRGESEKLVRTLFKLAQSRAPSVIFFDEVEALVGQRGLPNEHEATRRFQAELLVQMDGITQTDSTKSGAVLVLAATNHPWMIDEAFRRRFEKRIYVPLPDRNTRAALLSSALCSVALESDVNLEELSAMLEGYSGADIVLVARDAAMMFLRRKIAGLSCEEIRKLTAEELNNPVSMGDFKEAILRCKKSVKHTELERYRHWINEFGST
ncbi:katanin p60 ATPase-containing subunit A1-like isoform X3 [Artemia franciscana]|uniref:katanin p60 ATPase-containing subunit A1-like isoform X3 n=1 Tax=Artemia franciscana TaxID=6661 RepID=UPI0032DB935B